MRSATLSILTLLLPALTTGFGTISTLGQNREHEKITRAALACKGSNPHSDGSCFEEESIEELAGDELEFGAVGDPDKPRLRNGFEIGEGPEAHMDGADFFAGDPNYSKSRADATLTLQRGVNHLRMRFQEGITAAQGLLDSQGLIIEDEADVGFFGCDFQDDPDDNAKCKAIQGFGRALHGIQDFYSHSNWGDHAAPAYSAVNPPGLDQITPAAFLDLRSQSNIANIVPNDLSTGCFDDSGIIDVITGDQTPGVGVCLNRITHHTLNKDKGVINPDTGAATEPKTARGQFSTNFARAVALAIEDTQNQWRHFRSKLVDTYGEQKGSRMICALTRDNPEDCQGRKIAVVINSSGSNQDTDPSNLRVAAAKAFKDNLVSKRDLSRRGEPDHVTIIDLDSIDSNDGTSIARSISAAIDELVANKTYTALWKSGIVVLTDSEDSDKLAVYEQINRAYLNGIRVSMGFLSPPASPVPIRRGVHFNGEKEAFQRRQSQSVDLQQAVLRTGGVYSVVKSAEAQEDFFNLVLGRGATAIDDNTGSTVLKAGLTTAAIVSAASPNKYFTYTTQKDEALNITVSSVGPAGLHVVLHDILENMDIDKKAVSPQGQSSFVFTAKAVSKLELIVSGTNSLGNDIENIVTVELKT